MTAIAGNVAHHSAADYWVTCSGGNEIYQQVSVQALNHLLGDADNDPYWNLKSDSLDSAES